MIFPRGWGWEDRGEGRQRQGWQDQGDPVSIENGEGNEKGEGGRKLRCTPALLQAASRGTCRSGSGTTAAAVFSWHAVLPGNLELEHSSGQASAPGLALGTGLHLWLCNSFLLFSLPLITQPHSHFYRHPHRPHKHTYFLIAKKDGGKCCKVFFLSS